MKNEKLTLFQAYVWVIRELFTAKARWISLLLVGITTFGLILFMAQALMIGRLFESLPLGLEGEDAVRAAFYGFAILWISSLVVEYIKTQIEIYLWFLTYLSVNQGINRHVMNRSPQQLKELEEILGLSALARFRAAVNRVKEMVLFMVLAELISIIVALAFTGYYNILAAVIIITYIFVAFFWARVANKKTSIVGRVLDKVFRMLDRFVDVRWDNPSQVIHGGKHERDTSIWVDLALGLKKDHFWMWFRYETHLSLRNLFGIFFVLAILLLGIEQYYAGSITLGILYSSYIWTKQVWDKVWRFSNVDRILQKTGLTIVEGVEALMTPPTIQNPSIGEIPDIRNGIEIEFRNVTFGYDKNTLVLDGADLIMTYGNKYGLVGRTGAGKSTLMELVRGDVMPQSGVVLINGVPTNKINLNWWRAVWQYSPQDPNPYPDTLRGVASYMVPEGVDVSDAEITKLLEYLGLDDLLKHPKGLDREILKRGSDLSGGQRQRIMIAMAYLGKTALLILDEPTSSLDSAAEKSVTRLLEEFPMVITAAHRLGTVKKYKIIELRNKKIFQYFNLREASMLSPFVRECAELQKV